MNDFEWLDFVKEILTKGKKVNLKEECKKRHVSLNTLYRKVLKLEKIEPKIYKEFMALHPYKPRDREEYDFEQLMRESILTGISQKGLEAKYDISKRTIQRKFAEIEQNNFKLYSVYKTYVNLKQGESLRHEVIDEISSEYIPQIMMTEQEKLKDKRQKFIDSMKHAGKIKDKNLKNHYREQIERVNKQIESLNNNQEKEI